MCEYEVGLEAAASSPKTAQSRGERPSSSLVLSAAPRRARKEQACSEGAPRSDRRSAWRSRRAKRAAVEVAARWQEGAGLRVARSRGRVQQRAPAPVPHAQVLARHEARAGGGLEGLRGRAIGGVNNASGVMP